ncbi:HWE histidine kinase domain-containing protein [Bradyrhizobium sp.]|uniref:HWE histidine kinase domain-containing protein n=1 Tax=Bradyrhizobium sp. TaxID=376 RepID=UPI003C1C20CF
MPISQGKAALVAAEQHGKIRVAWLPITGSNSVSETANKSNEQKVAEAAVDGFRKNLGPFVVAAETTRMAMVFTDAKEFGNPIIFANDSFLSLTGYGREEVLGQSFNFLMAQPADTEALAHIAAEFKGNTDGGSEIRYRRKDNSEFWATIFVSPVRDENGIVVQNFASFVDLTRHKEDEAQSRMLIGELNHRVKNILSTVQSIVWQTLRTASDPRMIRESIESRLFALSRSHDLLTRENWHSAGLCDVINDAMEPFAVADGRAERIVVMGENIRLAPQAALALGIVFNELATNAVKYGAFSSGAGSILIEWTAEPAPVGVRLLLRWREKGGPPVTPPAHKGFGSRVIERGLAHEPEGTVDLDYRPDGLVCTMTLRAPNR